MNFLTDIVDNTQSHYELTIGLVSALSAVLVSFLIPFITELIRNRIVSSKQRKTRCKHSAVILYEWILKEEEYLQTITASQKTATMWPTISEERICNLQTNYIKSFSLSWYEIGFVFSIFEYEELFYALKKFDDYKKFIDDKKI